MDVDAGPGGQRAREYERGHRQFKATQEEAYGATAVVRYGAEQSYDRFAYI